MSQKLRKSSKKYVHKPFDYTKKKQYDTNLSTINSEIISQSKNNTTPLLMKVDINYDHDAEERFMQMSFKIENLKNAEPKQRKQKIKIFVASTVRTVMSVGFKQLQLDKFTDKKLRQLFCNNVIANVVKFGNQNKLSQQQLQYLDEHLQKKLLSFLKQRYPQNESNETNRKFQSMIVPVDNFQSNQNDLVYQSGVKFRFNESADYSSQIMQFLNYLINITKKQQLKKVKTKDDEGEEKEEDVPIGDTLAEAFFIDMEEFFKKVQDPFWMVYAKNKQFDIQKKQNDSIFLKQIEGKFKDQLLQKEQNKQVYKKKVKQYTKYLIGQKLSQNVAQFSKKDIEQKNFKVSNPGLMRILTKWCEQLKNNLEESNINSRDERFRMEDGSERYIKKQQKKDLYLQIRTVQKQLQNFLKEIKQNIYFNQQIVLSDERSTKAFSDFASEFQGITGYFATFMKKSYENYLISYLNKLIHCIMSAQQKFKSKFPKNDHYKIAVNLISFKIGDLLRCKCSSKQTEIVALYNYLVYYCDKNKDKLELVRVKNRLSSGTKDILINLKYKKTLLVQMQLAIDQQSSKFIKLSDKANHFIYELERATFGPMSEMCNVYTAIDPRFQFFNKKFQAISDQRAIYLKKNKILDYSFLCCQQLKFKQHKSTVKKIMDRHHTRPSSSKLHKKLNQSQTIKNIHVKSEIKIASARKKAETKISIKEYQYEQKKVSQKRYKQFTHPIWCKKCEKFTASLNINIKHRQCLNCLATICSSCCVRHQFKQKYKNNEQIIQFSDLTKDSDKILQKKIIIVNMRSKTGKEQEMYIAYFNFKVMIFQYQKDQQKNQLKFIVQTKKQKDFENFFINKYIKSLQNVTIEEKNEIEPLLYSQILKLMVKNVNKKLRKFFVFEQLKVDDKIFKQKMQTVQTINLRKTELNSIDNVVKVFPNAKVLMLHKNNLKSIKGIQVLKSLDQLVLQGNKLSELPVQVKQLINLQSIILTNNLFDKFPQPLCNIVNLKVINIKQNKLTQIHPNIKNLKSLKNFRLTQNMISKLPQQFKELTNLKQIDLGKNSFQQFPEVLKFMSNLQIIILSQNSIYDIPDDTFDSLINIKKISLKQKESSKNRIKQFPVSLQNKIKLQSIDLSNNDIQELPSYVFDRSCLPNLQQFIITNNKIKKLKLPLIINLSKGKQMKLDQKNKNKQLRFLKLNGNLLSQIPNQFFIFFKSLQVLELGNNKISQISVDIKQLTNLKQIDLSGFDFNAFPTVLLSLNKLQTIKLDNNKISQLPQNFASNLKLNLIQLSLKNNAISKFPIQLLECKNLEILRLDKNKLKELHPKISKMDEKMFELSLSENIFQRFPIEITECKKLQSLILSKNKITDIPQKIKNMESLQKLNLLQNQIIKLPQQLAQLKSLTEINVNSSKISEQSKKKIIQLSKNLNHRLKLIGPPKKQK